MIVSTVPWFLGKQVHSQVQVGNTMPPISTQDQPNAPLGRGVDENAVVDVAQENG